MFGTIVDLICHFRHMGQDYFSKHAQVHTPKAPPGREHQRCPALGGISRHAYSVLQDNYVPAIHIFPADNAGTLTESDPNTVALKINWS